MFIIKRRKNKTNEDASSDELVNTWRDGQIIVELGELSDARCDFCTLPLNLSNCIHET